MFCKFENKGLLKSKKSFQNLKFPNRRKTYAKI